MPNDINVVLKIKKGLKLMTHVVAGYPDLRTSGEIVELMAANGADFIEIQIPFSDPLADGPTIMKANHRALQNGVRPEDCLEMVGELKGKVTVPLILMTYANIPFRMGIDRFAEKAASACASGVIIPDLPFDEMEGIQLENFFKRDLHVIPVISPGMKARRLQTIASRVSGFLYLTLRVGTTGAIERTDPDGPGFIARVRQRTSLPLAAGFGLSSVDRVLALKDIADIAVIGSHLISVFDSEGFDGVSTFVSQCREGLSPP